MEICPAAAAITQSLAARIAQHGGLALILDYGGWRARGDTFQALRHHAFADPLQNPGEADLTAHVDFEALAQVARAEGATVHGPVTQGEFLIALGGAADLTALQVAALA